MLLSHLTLHLRKSDLKKIASNWVSALSHGRKPDGKAVPVRGQGLDGS